MSAQQEHRAIRAVRRVWDIGVRSRCKALDPDRALQGQRGTQDMQAGAARCHR
jgi:hypothetical protein